MRFTAIVIIIAISALGINLQGQAASDWRKVAEAIPLGSKVKISTFEGKRFGGTLMRVDDTSMLIKRSTRRPEPAITVTFDSVTNLERESKGSGFHMGKALAIGAASGAGFFLTLLAFALQFDKRR